MSRALKPPSQADRILAALRRGPCTADVLYRNGGGVVHSRVATLRSRGHIITCERLPGRQGPESFLYRLEHDAVLDGAGEANGLAAISPQSPAPSSTTTLTAASGDDSRRSTPPSVDRRGEVSPALQLELLGAA